MLRARHTATLARCLAPTVSVSTPSFGAREFSSQGRHPGSHSGAASRPHSQQQPQQQPSPLLNQKGVSLTDVTSEWAAAAQRSAARNQSFSSGASSASAAAELSKGAKGGKASGKHAKASAKQRGAAAHGTASESFRSNVAAHSSRANRFADIHSPSGSGSATLSNPRSKSSVNSDMYDHAYDNEDDDADDGWLDDHDDEDMSVNASAKPVRYTDNARIRSNTNNNAASATTQSSAHIGSADALFRDRAEAQSARDTIAASQALRATVDSGDVAAAASLFLVAFDALPGLSRALATLPTELKTYVRALPAPARALSGLNAANASAAGSGAASAHASATVSSSSSRVLTPAAAAVARAERRPPSQPSRLPDTIVINTLIKGLAAEAARAAPALLALPALPSRATPLPAGLTALSTALEGSSVAAVAAAEAGAGAGRRLHAHPAAVTAVALLDYLRFAQQQPRELLLHLLRQHEARVLGSAASQEALYAAVVRDRNTTANNNSNNNTNSNNNSSSATQESSSGESAAPQLLHDGKVSESAVVRGRFAKLFTDESDVLASSHETWARRSDATPADCTPDADVQQQQQQQQQADRSSSAAVEFRDTDPLDLSEGDLAQFTLRFDPETVSALTEMVRTATATGPTAASFVPLARAAAAAGDRALAHALILRLRAWGVLTQTDSSQWQYESESYGSSELSPGTATAPKRAAAASATLLPLLLRAVAADGALAPGQVGAFMELWKVLTTSSDATGLSAQTLPPNAGAASQTAAQNGAQWPAWLWPRVESISPEAL